MADKTYLPKQVSRRGKTGYLNVGKDTVIVAAEDAPDGDTEAVVTTEKGPKAKAAAGSKAKDK